MQLQAAWTIVYLVAVSTLGFSLITETINAQTRINTKDPLEIPLDEQASYLRGLETRSANQWLFPTQNQAAMADIYQIDQSNRDITIKEQRIPEWRNTGDDPNYSVLVDIEQFLEEN